MREKPKVFGALVKAICVGWLGVFIVDILSLLLFGSHESEFSGILQGILGFSVAYLLIGLPIALVVGLAFGLIVWNLMWAVKLTSRNHTIGFGALMGFVLGLPTYYVFMTDDSYLFAHLDLASTILVGAFAGWVFYNNIKFPRSNLEDTFT